LCTKARAPAELRAPRPPLTPFLDDAVHAANPRKTPRGLTRQAFTEPIRRVLQDGAADGSLASADPEETATLLLNLVSWTYRHLRRGHGWEPARARDGVLRIALDGVAARPPIAALQGAEPPREGTP
jgi:AcrR family transcriptional regulator